MHNLRVFQLCFRTRGRKIRGKRENLCPQILVIRQFSVDSEWFELEILNKEVQFINLNMCDKFQVISYKNSIFSKKSIRFFFFFDFLFYIFSNCKFRKPKI